MFVNVHEPFMASQTSVLMPSSATLSSHCLSLSMAGTWETNSASWSGLALSRYSLDDSCSSLKNFESCQGPRCQLKTLVMSRQK